MSIRTYLVFGLLFIISDPSSAQTEGIYSNRDKNFTQYIGYRMLSGAGYTPSYTTSSFDGTGTIEEAMSYIMFVGAGYEARYNVYTNEEDFALALNGVADLDVKVGEFVGLIPAIGTYVSANFNNGSTYNNINRTGVGIGLGLKGMHYGISDLASSLDKTFKILPVLKIDIVNTISYTEDINRGFSFQFGFPKKYVDGYGETKRSNMYLEATLRVKI